MQNWKRFYLAFISHGIFCSKTLLANTSLEKTDKSSVTKRQTRYSVDNTAGIKTCFCIIFYHPLQEGTSSVSSGDKEFHLAEDENLLVPKNTRWGECCRNNDPEFWGKGLLLLIMNSGGWHLSHCKRFFWLSISSAFEMVGLTAARFVVGSHFSFPYCRWVQHVKKMVVLVQVHGDSGYWRNRAHRLSGSDCELDVETRRIWRLNTKLHFHFVPHILTSHLLTSCNRSTHSSFVRVNILNCEKRHCNAKYISQLPTRIYHLNVTLFVSSRSSRMCIVCEVIATEKESHWLIERTWRI